MAGPYHHFLKFSNGQVLDIYLAANVAVGVELPVNINGPAASTSLPYFRFSQAVRLVDSYNNGETAGQFEFIANDQPTGRYIFSDASNLNTNTARVTVPIGFRPGVQYKLIVRTAGAA